MVDWIGTNWGSPLNAYRKDAITRLSRLRNRPLLTIQKADALPPPYVNISFPYSYLPAPHDWTVMLVDMYAIFGQIPNQYVMSTHNDKWLIYCGNCTAGKKFQIWLNRALRFCYLYNYHNY
jgi:hypothetical protein